GAERADMNGDMRPVRQNDAAGRIRGRRDEGQRHRHRDEQQRALAADSQFSAADQLQRKLPPSTLIALRQSCAEILRFGSIGGTSNASFSPSFRMFFDNPWRAEAVGYS